METEGKTQYKTLFFDLDRTLWDFDTNSDNVLKAIYSEFELKKYAPRLEKFLKVYKKENHRMWNLYREGKANREEVSFIRFARTLHHFGMPKNLAPTIAENYIDRLPGQTALFPNTIDVLTELQKRYQLVIITNGFEDIQHKKLKNSKLTPYFSHVVSSESAGASKPRPGIFFVALQLSDSQPSEALMIGDDHRTDIQGAKRSEIDQVWFLPKGERRGKATYTISDLGELLTKVHL